MPTIEYPYRAAGWETEIYPMPSFPMLVVSDLETSSAWYQRSLGFADVFTMRGPENRPLLAHLRWCTCADLLLTPARTPLEGNPGVGMTLNFATVNVDELAARARDAGATIVAGPINRPWNTRDVTIADPDGYLLNFTAPLSQDEGVRRESFDRLVERARQGGE
jgi:uncharacterized glyoxalase superfamily protein PhnB